MSRSGSDNVTFDVRDMNAVRARLVQLRDELLGLSTISQEARSTVDLDQQSVGRLSRMDALQQQAMAQATERQRLADLQRIEAALTRVDDDEYGFCLECGDEIAAKRLHIDPAAALCVRCAR